MSTRPKVHAPKPRPGEGYAAIPAIVVDRTQPGSREKAQKLTHDALVQLWGPARRSGVWWTERAGAAGARLYNHLCEGLEHRIDPEAAEALRDNPRALVVVAWAIVAEGTPPNAPEPGRWVR